MELVNNLANNQLALYIPVALALVGAILVFAFGFKSAEQPPFEKIASITTDDRKASGKKRKLKEKKPTLNGHVVNTENKSEKSSPSKETKKPKEADQKKSETPKQEKKKPEPTKPKKELEFKKVTKPKSANEKPVDFDEGNWETVPTKGDKKKKQDSPVKKETSSKTKAKKPEKTVEVETVASNEVTKEVPEKKEQVPEKKEPEPEVKEVVEVVAVEEKKEKKQEKKKKEELKVEKVEAPKPAKVTPQLVVQEVEVSIEKNEVASKEDPSGGVAFDELGDVWTEAKGQKKSKKKSRRDN